MKKLHIVFISLVIAVIFVVFGLVFLFYTRTQAPLYDIRQFGGSLQGIGENYITVNGGLITEEEGIPDAFFKMRDFTFFVDKSTRFNKTVFRIPQSAIKKEQQGGYSWDVSVEEMISEESPGSFNDLKELVISEDFLKNGAVHVRAEFNSTIYNTDTPTASVVFYQVFTLPDLTFLEQ